MSNFNLIEQKIGDFFSKFPVVKDILKKRYYQINYLLYRQKQNLILNNQYRIQSVAEYFGVEMHPPYFFGYYDISPWSKKQDYFIIHERGNANILNICLLEKGKKTIIGSTSAWNWQQGSMLQWLSEDVIGYNHFENDSLGCVIFNIKTSSKYFIPFPIQAVQNSGNKYLSINYNTLTSLRPEYGYGKLGANFIDLSSNEDGIWETDFLNGSTKLIISLNDVLKFIPTKEKNCPRKINHVTYSPNDEKIAFMQRWYLPNGEKKSQLLAFDIKSNSFSLLLNDKVVSHYTWIDSSTLLVWANHSSHGKQYYLVSSNDLKVNIFNQKVFNFSDGHPASNPISNRIVSDTYPNKSRLQTLFEINDDYFEEIIQVLAPLKFYGPKRCDLHPRFSPDGELISIDSAFNGSRKSYIIEHLN